jgi:hypothetical protein
MTTATWQYGDYTIWGWVTHKRHRPRRCHTRSMKTCQKLVDRVPGIAGTKVVDLVNAARRTKEKKETV